MKICHGCGGVIGRDCFNPIECEQITRSMAAEYQTQPNYPAQISELLEENESLKTINAELVKSLEDLISALPSGNYTSLYVEKAKSILAKSKL